MNEKLKTELVRKGIHFLIALSPLIAAYHREAAIALLCGGIVVYTIMETLRFRGVEIPLVSTITKIASRPRDQGQFVLGPVTLALGALMSLQLFSAQNAAIAIYALAFGDGASGIFGRAFGHIRPAFLQGKSVEGCFSCFIAVAMSAWFASGSIRLTVIASMTAVVVEALPLRDWDNIIFPLAVGLAVSL